MSTPYAYAISDSRSPSELGSTGELRPGLNCSREAARPGPVEPVAISAWRWCVAAGLAVAAAALRALS